MVIKDTTSCAMQEITGLAAFTNQPREAMKAFCRLVFDDNGEASVRFGGIERCTKGSLYSFYLFSTAVAMTKGYEASYPAYAQQFTQFIRENKLGEVLESPIRPNKTFHSHHGNQIFIWTIETEAVKKWWKENKDEKDRVSTTQAKANLEEDDYQLEEISYDSI